MNIFKKMKASVKAWLDRMAETNKKEYGDGVPDCCKMNSQVRNSKKPQ